MKKITYWLVPLGWMGIIFYSSATSYEEQDIKPFMGDLIDFSFLEPYLNWISFTYNESLVSIATLGVDGLIEFFIRKGAHFGVFFILACLFYFAFKKTTQIQQKLAIIYSFCFSVAYAITDEIHQGFTPNRTPYIGDIIIDSFGALCAVICIVLISKWRRLSTQRKKTVL